MLSNKMKVDKWLYPILAVYSVVLTQNVCLSYKNYTVENTNVCSPLKTKTLKLGGKPSDHAIVVSEARTFNHWTGYKVFRCKFDVKELQKNKIIAVIQKLSFRHDETGNCTDYVQFKSDSEESKKFCGVIEAFHSESHPIESDSSPSHIAPNAFIVHEKGKLDVIIYVANKKLNPSEELDLQIVFTSAQDCSTPSLDYSHCGYNLCIRKEFFKDGLVNCPYTNCPDEDGCIQNTQVESGEEIGTRGPLAVIAVIVAVCLVFFGCIWFTYRCCSYRLSRSMNARMIHLSPPQRQGVNRDQGSGQQRVEVAHRPAHPSAHPSNDGAVMADKDLPPPYESLFPER